METTRKPEARADRESSGLVVKIQRLVPNGFWRFGSIAALTPLLQSRGGYVGFQILLLLSPARLKRLRP